MKQLRAIILSSLLIGQAWAIDIPVHSGDDLQAKINTAACGDRVVPDAGVTWDGGFTLPAIMGCTTDTWLISSAAASLPTGRCGSADATNMFRIRSLGANTSGSNSTGATLIVAPNAGYWHIKGAEFSDNAAQSAIINWLIDMSDPTVNHLTIDCFWAHQKETGSNYNRTTQRLFEFEGDTLSLTNGTGEVIGYYYAASPNSGGSSFQQMDSTFFLCQAACKNVTIQNNSSNTWWNAIFLGSVDTPPQYTATVTGGSTTSGTFSTTTGLANGVIVRFGVTGTLTLNSTANTVTFLTGPSITNADIAANGASATIEIVDSAPSRLLNLCNSSDTERSCPNSPGGCSMGTCSFAWAQSSTHPVDGTYSYVMYQTAQVSSVVMSTVNYTPIGHDQLLHSPSSAAWCINSGCNPSNLTISKNTFNIDQGFATSVWTNKSTCPKGGYEIKNADTMLWSGNYFTGYPGALSYTSANQNGTAPWTTTRGITFQSEWVDPIAGTPGCNREALLWVGHGDLHTVSPSNNMAVNNSYFGVGIQTVLSGESEGGSTWSVTHNTAQNLSGGTAYNGFINANAPILSMAIQDNIGNYKNYGLLCQDPPNTQAHCYPSAVIDHNVIVDTQAVGFGTTAWGANSILSPVPTAYSQVGFTNLAGQVYSLANTSPYKGAGTGGSDPGVDWTALQAALGSAPKATSGISGRVTVSGNAAIH